MRTTLVVVAVLATAVAGVVACDPVAGNGCPATGCFQEEGPDWEIDIDGHKVYKPKSKAPVVVTSKKSVPQVPRPRRT